jgi:hypothetical protein
LNQEQAASSSYLSCCIKEEGGNVVTMQCLDGCMKSPRPTAQDAEMARADQLEIRIDASMTIRSKRDVSENTAVP